MLTIGTLAILLSVLFAIKISSSVFMLLPQPPKHEFAAIVGVVLLVLAALTLGITFAIFADSQGSSDSRLSHPPNPANSELRSGSDSETVHRSRFSLFALYGLVALGLSSLLSFLFPFLVAFLFPFLSPRYQEPAKRSLPALRGVVPLTIEFIGLLASILGILSFYLNHLTH